MGLDIGLIDPDQLSRQLFIRPCAAVIFAPNSRVKSVRRITTIAKFNITSSAPNAALGNTESKTQPSREVIIVGTQNIWVTIAANNNAEMNLLLSRSIMISWAQDTAITGDKMAIIRPTSVAKKLEETAANDSRAKAKTIIGNLCPGVSTKPKMVRHPTKPQCNKTGLASEVKSPTRSTRLKLFVTESMNPESDDISNLGSIRTKTPTTIAAPARRHCLSRARLGSVVA